jgi:20S proteasome alpha/beta subunit
MLETVGSGAGEAATGTAGRTSSKPAIAGGAKMLSAMAAIASFIRVSSAEDVERNEADGLARLALETQAKRDAAEARAVRGTERRWLPP